MFRRIRENLFSMLTSRLLLLFIVFTGMAVILIYRLFDLQIVNGETYLNNFQLMIEKKKVIEGTRGNIYDRNGNILAYNELAYSVAIEDVYESDSNQNRNEKINATLYKLIHMIEGNGDSVTSDFNIIIDDDGNYAFTVEGTRLKRFKADVYGHLTIDKLTYQQEIATAYEVMEDLCEKYEIGAKEDGKKGDFHPFVGYTRKEALQIATIRYRMGLYSYQKYIATTVATDVSMKTVAMIMENIGELDGVSIEEDMQKEEDRIREGLAAGVLILDARVSLVDVKPHLKVIERGKGNGDKEGAESKSYLQR